jgi:hypothetical protein
MANCPPHDWQRNAEKEADMPYYVRTCSKCNESHYLLRFLVDRNLDPDDENEPHWQLLPDDE